MKKEPNQAIPRIEGPQDLSPDLIGHYEDALRVEFPLLKPPNALLQLDAIRQLPAG